MTTPPRDASDTNNTAKPRENRKSGLDPGDRGSDRGKQNSEKSSVHATPAGVRIEDEGKSKDWRKEDRSGDERRPKREREEPTEKKERHRERRFREVKERESPRVPERESSRERSWRPSSDRGRWAAEERPKSHREQAQEKGTMRGGHRGGYRSFTGGSRQTGGFGSNQGRYSSGGERDSRQGNWGGDSYNEGNRDSSYRRQPISYQSKGEKWQHDLFDTIVNGDKNEPEEDTIAKIEAFLAS